MIIKKLIIKIQNRFAGKQVKPGYVQLTTPLGNLFAFSGFILSLLSIVFFYKGCIEHSWFNYHYMAYGICLVLFAVLAFVSSLKVNDRLIEHQ